MVADNRPNASVAWVESPLDSGSFVLRISMPILVDGEELEANCDLPFDLKQLRGHRDCLIRIVEYLESRP